MNVFGPFRRRRGGLERRFTPAERAMLEDLVVDLAERLGGVDAPGADADRVLDRLLPETYRDDPLAELEFRRAVRARAALNKSEILSRIHADVVGEQPVHLDDEAAVLWLKGLGDLRLAYATRYGMEAVTGSGRVAAVYAWLSWLQSGLVDAVAG